MKSMIFRYSTTFWRFCTKMDPHVILFCFLTDNHFKNSQIKLFCPPNKQIIDPNDRWSNTSSMSASIVSEYPCRTECAFIRGVPAHCQLDAFHRGHPDALRGEEPLHGTPLHGIRGEQLLHGIQCAATAWYFFCFCISKLYFGRQFWRP